MDNNPNATNASAPQQAPAQPQQGYQQPQGAPQPQYNAPAPAKGKTLAGILAILLGSLGIDLLYCGKTKAGVVLLVVDLVLFWTFLVPIVLGILALVRGIKMLVATQPEFEEKYVTGPNEWPLV